MTRLAGANAAVWSDIFLENADEIAAALAGFRTSLDELERALQAGDRERSKRRSPPPPPHASGWSPSPTAPSRRS